jgi:hypothetical protein
MATVEQINKKVVEHDGTLKKHDTMLQKHEHALFGIEDLPGIAEEVKDLKTVVKSMSMLWEQQKVMNKLIAFLASAIGLSVIALIWSIITHTVEIVHP